jgi:putative ABC transport system ATP-binding protein
MSDTDAEGVFRPCHLSGETRRSRVWYTRTVREDGHRRRVYAHPEAYLTLDEDAREGWVRETTSSPSLARSSVDTTPATRPLGSAKPEAADEDGDLAVRARGLTRVYTSGDRTVRAVDGIDLDVREGEFVSVMGPSGSGKSTLLHLLGLLETPSEGELAIGGDRVDGLDRDERARARNRRLGFVFQDFHLVSTRSALENVTLPMTMAGIDRDTRRERARELLERLGLGERTGHRPSELSGGQKQRVALARAVALEPEILLADEPTGNLDSDTSREVMQVLTELNDEGRTILQVTHDPDMAAYGTRVVHLQDGRIERQTRTGRARP